MMANLAQNMRRDRETVFMDPGERGEGALIADNWLLSLPGLTRQSIHFARSFSRDGYAGQARV
jgi:hypothetical protein